MAIKRDRLIEGAQFIMRIFWAGNRILALAFFVMLVLTFPFYSQLFAKIARRHAELNTANTINGIRVIFIVGIIWCFFIDRFSSSLLLIIKSARIGDPFIHENVFRINLIGWSLVAMQLLDLAVGWIARMFNIQNVADNHSTPSISGWLSVVVVFALARIFAIGAAMREEQQGTV